MSDTIVFLDTETTGVHPGRKVWEIAMIRRDEQGQRETQFFIDVDLSNADPFGLKVGGFYERHPYGKFIAGKSDRADMSPFRKRDDDPFDGNLVWEGDAAEEIARWTHGAHIVGAVPNFDTEVLSKMFRKHNDLTPSWHYHLVDIEALMVGYLRGEHGWRHKSDETLQGVVDLVSPPWRSDDLSQAIGVAPPTPDERHTALGDARWAMRVYDHIMGTDK